MKHGWLLAAALGTLIGASAPMAQAQGENPYSAGYCEPEAGIKLLYTNRAYKIEPKPMDAPPLFYTYTILAPGGGEQHVERRSQLLFDDGSDPWRVQTGADEVRSFWPLQPSKALTLDRSDPNTGMHSEVSFFVLGLEPIETTTHIYRSWKIRRFDHNSDGTHYFQFLWYSPELCTLSAFTDSQQRMVRLLRVLKPGDHDYDRPLAVKNHHLFFADSNEQVK